MGKINKVVTHEQQLLLDEFKADSFLASHFYFTGGTALSLFYLQHRESIDLDFFSHEQFDAQIILKKVTAWGGFPNKSMVKVDFAHYPYKQLEESKKTKGMLVDSKLDIATNKLLVAQQRAEVKDFVDLYFLLRDFTIWDLIEGVKVKFKVRLDPFVIGSDLLKIERFDYLPKMVKPLLLEELKAFFTQKAKELGKKSVE